MGALVRSTKKEVALTRAAQEALAQARGQQYLTFTVGAESFAIPISRVKEIIEYRSPTDVPMMPGFIRGVINLRGHVVPVIDLSVRFGRSRADVSRRTCIVILEIIHDAVDQDVGIVVDTVSAVLDIADADIEPPPSFGAKLRSDFMTGMGKVGEKFVIILDTDHVLSIEELALLGGVDEAASAAAATVPSLAPPP